MDFTVRGGGLNLKKRWEEKLALDFFILQLYKQ